MRKVEESAVSSMSKVNVAPVASVKYPVPKVCLIDVAEDVAKKLGERLYDCVSGTLGAYVNAPKSQPRMQNLIKPLASLPSNLHEFDIVVVDLSANEKINLVNAEADLSGVSGNAAYAFLSAYPEQVFNSKAWGARVLQRELQGMFEKQSLSIIFAEENHQVTYELVEIGSSGPKLHGREQVATLCLCPGNSGYLNKHGKKIVLPEEGSRFSAVLEKYLDGAEYHVVFNHPFKWRDNGEKVYSEKFIPILVNDIGQVVGYAVPEQKGYTIVLPQLKNKAQFLVDFFETLAEIFPEIFPEHGRFAWLNDGSYPLPGEEELRAERLRIEETYVADVAANEAALIGLKEEYKFLRTMLTATGDELVEAVKEFFTWLEFPSVKSMDEHSAEVLEEDIQVELDVGLLVVEVKGIGGTSKDKECGQISKIKHRRQEERQAFDVKALYVVNHQRHLPPRSRINPPFTERQIGDAKLDKRGLVSTWQLYNVYFDIAKGLLSKADVRAQLLSFGAVSFAPPQLVEVGVVNEVFKKGLVIILDLAGQRLTKGMNLIAQKGDDYTAVTILSLQLDGADVEVAENGEVGVSVSNVVKKGSKIFIQS